MGASGADVLLSPAALAVFNYYVECKKRKAFSIYKDFEQSKDYLQEQQPLLVIEGDRKPALAVITLEHFMELVKHATK